MAVAATGAAALVDELGLVGGLGGDLGEEAGSWG